MIYVTVSAYWARKLKTVGDTRRLTQSEMAEHAREYFGLDHSDSWALAGWAASL